VSSLVFLDQGEVILLTNQTAGNLTLRLYINDVTAGLTPDQIDALNVGDFTEANFAGYAAQTLTGGAWTITAGNPTRAVHNAQKSFVRSSTGAPQLIFGYLITNPGVFGVATWFEQFDAPISIEFLNDTINITPTISLDDAEGNAVESGTIVGTGRATAPTGWHLCDGSAISRTTFASLFAAIGTAYGVGDGSTTFNVPDLRQRFPLGKAASGTGATLGGTGGTVDHVHALNTASSHAKAAVFGSGGGTTLEYDQKDGVASYTTDAVATGLNATAPGAARTRGVALGGNSDTANPPFTVLNFLIKD
jgi:microcystin-dependent protein